MNREHRKHLTPPVHLHALAPPGDEPHDQKLYESSSVPVIYTLMTQGISEKHSGIYRVHLHLQLSSF